MCEKGRGTNSNRPSNSSIIFCASATTFGSRSNAITRAPAVKKAREYPPAPNVASTTTRPRKSPNARITASNKTGICFIILSRPESQDLQNHLRLLPPIPPPQATPWRQLYRPHADLTQRAFSRAAKPK